MDYYSHGECLYNGYDAPGFADISVGLIRVIKTGGTTEYRIKAKFLHQVVDVCNNEEVVEEITSTLEDSLVVSRATFFGYNGIEDIGQGLE